VEATSSLGIKDSSQMRDYIEDNIVDDGPDHLASLYKETYDAIINVLNRVELEVTMIQVNAKIEPTVHVDGHYIYKSTLVLQLNDNNFFSKDWLAGLSSGARLLCIGLDYGVHFV